LKGLGNSSDKSPSPRPSRQERGIDQEYAERIPLLGERVTVVPPHITFTPYANSIPLPWGRGLG